MLKVSDYSKVATSILILKGYKKSNNQSGISDKQTHTEEPNK